MAVYELSMNGNATTYQFYAETGGSLRLREQNTRRVYYEKDVLRPGNWETDGGSWNVTPKTLKRLVRNFNLTKRRGIKIPVVWNHSRDARDQIGEISKLYIRNGILLALFWAKDPDDVKKLGQTVSEVSVEASEDWVDGKGNEYDIAITHLGVVNLPVVGSQGNFKRLRLAQGGRREMSAELEAFQAEKHAVETDGPGNPPNWVANEALWKKAKSAARKSGADDIYAFAVWWYLNQGGKKKSRTKPVLNFVAMARGIVSRRRLAR